MNPAIKVILSEQPYLTVDHLVTYDAILQSSNDNKMLYYIKRDLIQKFMDLLVNKKFPSITAFDEPEGRHFRLTAFVNTYQELEQLLEKAYTLGQLDYQGQRPNLSNFNDLSKTFS